MQTARRVDPTTPHARASSLHEPVADADNSDLLMAVAHNGSRVAFEELFTRFAKRIYGLGLKLSHNEQLSKDVVQDVMLYVWQNASRYNAIRGSVKSWIFTLTRNKCIDALRRARRQPLSVSSEEIWPEHLQDSEIPGLRMRAEATAATEIDVSTIVSLSGSLPRRQREAIQMIYEKDHTHEEAARLLSIPLGTIKTRLRLGVIKLRDMVKDAHD